MNEQINIIYPLGLRRFKTISGTDLEWFNEQVNKYLEMNYSLLQPIITYLNGGRTKYIAVLGVVK